MAELSVTPHRKHPYSNTSQEHTFAEKCSRPWPAEEYRPYLVRHQDAKDSDTEWNGLPDLPFLYLANMGPFRARVMMPIYGTDLDVCKTEDGVKRLRDWKSDPAEIALYERPDPKQPLLKLVGVYPVVDGHARLNLQEVHGKAQTADEALHVFPGSLFNRILGFGWPPTKAAE